MKKIILFFCFGINLLGLFLWIKDQIDKSTVIADRAIQNETLDCDTLIGYQALPEINSGRASIAIGDRNIYPSTIGNKSAIRDKAFHPNTTGSFNTVIGYRAIQNNTTYLDNPSIKNPLPKFKVGDSITRKDGWCPEGVIEQVILINKIDVSPDNDKLTYYGTVFSQYINGNVAIGDAEITVEVGDELYKRN